MSRRFPCWTCLQATAVLGLVVVLGSTDAADAPASKPAPNGAASTITPEAKAIHDGSLVFDGQNGLPWKLYSKGDSHFKQFDLRHPQKDLHTDIPRLRQGGVGAVFWSIYVPAASAKKGTAERDVLEQIDLIHRLAKTYPDVFEVALRSKDITRIQQEGKIASLIGIEGGHSLDNSLAVLRTYYQMGARFLTLTGTDNCDVADSAGDKAHHQGLSKFGEQVVSEMNRLGMIIDLCHCSKDTRKHALLLSRAPVMFSHTAAAALAPHPRNVDDETLKAVAKNGGIVMVNFYTAFLSPEGIKAYDARSKAAHKLRAQLTDDKKYQVALLQLLKDNPLPAADVRTVVNHIDHIVKVAGIDHVGLGSNFDGMGTAPKQLEDVSCFPAITQELLNRGYDKEKIQKVLGGNMYRVLARVEAESTGQTISNERIGR
ncbi:MAG: dipeptidase [Planctomycetia bacterium]|nr:dipeptidase [Planctomycetia bacterium]